MESRDFSEILQYLIDLTGCKIKDIAAELRYDNSYISKWVNNKNIPSPKISADTIDQLSDFFAKLVIDKGLEDGLIGLTEIKVPIYGEGNKKLIILSSLEDSYYLSLKKRQMDTSIETEKETDTYTNKKDICEVSMELIKKYVALSREKLVFYTNLDLFDNKNQNLANFSLFITKGIEIEFKWLRHYYSKEMNAEELYEIYDLATRAMFVNSEIYYTEDDSYPPFIYLKGAIALSFTVNNEGEVLMLTHSRNDNVLKQYDDICDHLFRREQLVERTRDSSTFELEMISEALFDDNKVYIHDAFLQGYFVPDHILEKVVARNNLTERDKSLLLRIRRAYQHLFSTTSIRLMLFKQALKKNLEDSKVYLGKYSFELTDEEWNETLDEVLRISKLNDDLKFAFIIDELFPYDLDLWESSMVVDSNNIWYKKNPDYADRYVDNYIHVISKEFNYKIYKNIESSFDKSYLRWIEPEEVVKLMRREAIENTIVSEF